MGWDIIDEIVIENNYCCFEFQIRKINRMVIIDFYSSTTMSDVDSLRSSRMTLDNPEVYFVKQLTPKRWKIYMIQALEEMQVKHVANSNLLIDLITIVQTIPEANFVQATLQIRPFKPEFVYEQAFQGEATHSTTASTIAHAAKFKGDILKNYEKMQKKQRITEKTLKNQLNKQYHPYRFIIKNFSRLLQLKYKQLVDIKKINVAEVQKRLRTDISIFTQFMHESSKPYRKLFKLEKNEDEHKTNKKMFKFIQGFIFQHPKLNSSCHKIMLYVCRSQYSAYLNEKIEDFATPETYDIPEEFKIDGSYVRSMSSLIQFSQSSNHQISMKKLIQFRSNILKDIDEHYVSKTGQSKDLQLNAEAQIEIIRFIVAKLKGWACQIYSQLKFLQVIYGDEEIAYKYEQASFIYTQITLAFQILGVE